mgnify:FL=1
MERTEQRELPGNDASWYREMIADRVDSRRVAVGVETETQPDESAESIEDAREITSTEPDAATLPNEVDAGGAVAGETVADQAGEFDGPHDDASASPAIVPVPVIADDAPVENTSEMVGQLWTARDASQPLEDWEPEEIDRKVGSARSFRWTTLIGVLAIVGLIVAGLVVLPSITQQRADSYRQSITDPLRELRAELPDTQASLAIATDPTSDGGALEGLTTQLTTLAAKASALDAATRADPPAAPLFTSSAPIDEVEPVRNQAEPLGSVALTIQRRIANLVEYRTLMSGFLVLPELPTVADSDTQAALRVELAAAQAESASILAELPNEAALESHTAMAREISQRFATWQVDYLEALRTNDADGAAVLIAELETSLAELETALVIPLAQIRREVDADLIDLAREIDEVTALADEIA